MSFPFLATEAWGNTSLGAVAGVWSVIIALAAANLALIVFNYSRLLNIRESLDAARRRQACLF